MQVLVGVDATDDLDVVGCCSRHVRPLVYDGWRGWLRPQPMSDTTVTGRPRPGSHQVTMSVEVGTSTGALGWPTCPGNDISVDLSVGQATQGRPAYQSRCVYRCAGQVTPREPARRYSLSLWWITPAPGWRSPIARLSALSGRSLVMRAPTAQPMTRRE